MALTIGLCLIPLFLTPLLPSIDFYAHVARYYALAHVGTDSALAANYQESWRLLPNLGLDVIGTGLMTILPPFLGAKVIAAMIILSVIGGTLLLARAVQGLLRPVNLALAGLAGYSFVLGWGFSNFLFATGISLCGVAGWIMLRERPGRQLALAMLLGVLIMLMHGLAFGLWGLMLFLVEVMLIGQTQGFKLATLVWRSIRLGLVAILPALLFISSQTAKGGEPVIAALGNLANHASAGTLKARLIQECWDRADSFLRVVESTWPMADRLFGLLLWGLIGWGLLRGQLRLAPVMRLVTAVFALMVVIMPPNLFGVGHLDERIPLILFALLASGLSAGRGSAGLVRGLVVLFVGHLLIVALGWAYQGQSYRKFLAAAEQLPTEGLAQAVFSEETQGRDGGRACKPLLFALLLQNQIAVPTFANQTQQPLRLIGPLQEALNRQKSGTVGPDTAQRIEAARASGFDTVITCEPVATPVEVPGMRLVGADGQWAIYHAD
ncbi:MAG: hypothetical protein WBA91_03660 [Paracoccaceae bacterium]